MADKLQDLGSLTLGSLTTPQPLMSVRAQTARWWTLAVWPDVAPQVPSAAPIEADMAALAMVSVDGSAGLSNTTPPYPVGQSVLSVGARGQRSKVWGREVRVQLYQSAAPSVNYAIHGAIAEGVGGADELPLLGVLSAAAAVQVGIPRFAREYRFRSYSGGGGGTHTFYTPSAAVVTGCSGIGNATARDWSLLPPAAALVQLTGATAAVLEFR